MALKVDRLMTLFVMIISILRYFLSDYAVEDLNTALHVAAVILIVYDGTSLDYKSVETRTEVTQRGVNCGFFMSIVNTVGTWIILNGC